MKTLLYIVAFLATLISATVHAATADVSIVNTVNKAMAVAASNSILPQALVWLGAFMALQFFITNFALLKSENDISAVIYKLAGSVAWFVVCAWILYNGPDFIDSVGNGILTKYAPEIPGAGTIITATLSLCTSLLIAIAATGTSIAGVGNSAIGMVLVYALFIVFAIGMYMAIKILMLHLELGLIIMLSPLSFSFLGLNSMRDQGIAPLKSLISLIYRIIILSIIFSAFSEVIGIAGTNLDAVSWKNPLNWGAQLNTIFSALSAFPVIAYLVYKSDAIAASLASGSTNMGPGDVAGAAAAGAAAGAAIMSGGAAAVGSATKIPSMADFQKSLLGGGDISNASGRGIGQTPDQAPSRAASMSIASGGAVGSSASGTGGPSSSASVDGAPVRPTSVETNSPGAAPSASGGTESNAAAGGKADPAGSESSAGGDSKSTGSAANDAPLAASGGAPLRPGVSKRGAAGDAPVRPESGSNAGSGATNAITGAGNGQQQQNNDRKEKTWLEHLGNTNNHIAQEKAATHISINTHHSD